METPKKSRPAQYAIISAVGAAVLVVIVVAVLVFYPLTQQPHIELTNVGGLQQGTPNPETTTLENDGRVVTTWGFNQLAILPGRYSLLFDNSFSIFSSKTVALTCSSGCQSQQFNVPPGDMYWVKTDMQENQTLAGSFTVSGGSGNDVNFSITADTCTTSYSFSFTLTNSGNADGYATVTLTVDSLHHVWSNNYLVLKGSQQTETHNITLPDCLSHTLTLAITTTSKA